MTHISCFTSTARCPISYNKSTWLSIELIQNAQQQNQAAEGQPRCAAMQQCTGCCRIPNHKQIHTSTGGSPQSARKLRSTCPEHTQSDLEPAPAVRHMAGQAQGTFSKEIESSAVGSQDVSLTAGLLSKVALPPVHGNVNCHNKPLNTRARVAHHQNPRLMSHSPKQHANTYATAPRAAHCRTACTLSYAPQPVKCSYMAAAYQHGQQLHSSRSFAYATSHNPPSPSPLKT